MTGPSAPAPTPASAAALVRPDAAALLEAVLELGRHLHLDMDEVDVAGRFVGVLGRLLPGRALVVRVLDPRTGEPARCYAVGGELRPGIETEAITLKESAIAKTGLKSAVAASARVRVGGRWDPPFHRVGAGFAVPLVAAGELYGALDVGYPPGVDAAEIGEHDEGVVLPLANQLAVALRGSRLYRDTIGLRDYTARLIEHANALIVGIDHRWRITVCNRALLQLTGYGRDELIGRDLRDVMPTEQRARLTQLFAAALRGASQDAIEILLDTRRGDRVRTVWSIAAIGGSHRAVDAVVAIGADQSKLEDLQRQVIQAERLATLGQIAAGVVHELNNPLTSIIVYAEHLLGKAEADAAALEGDREKLRRIVGSARRIMGFTRELVQYAKPVSSEVDLVEVNDVVRRSTSFCEHLFERNGIELRLILADEVPPLHAVPGQLEQVLINLVTNAAHAVEDDGGTVVVRTRAVRGHVEIEVADSGPGVPAPDRDRVFDPFFTTKTDGKGTGLGLSIVKKIVEQHRGMITIDAAREGGAAFVVALPLEP
ncbi:MAG: PAS domain S-box protein [Kofleriaceae bacterium]|nr:PAS domain S-box protein [Myxococcales bacterium]MCB9562432.1 PAS domain S-box protein [Kofleriaceae bacterium]